MFILVLLFLGNTKSFAQYPKILPEIKAQQDAIIAEANRLSDEAWEKALVIIEQEAKQGKPYIPWASRPNALATSIHSSFSLEPKVVECTLLEVAAEMCMW